MRQDILDIMPSLKEIEGFDDYMALILSEDPDGNDFTVEDNLQSDNPIEARIDLYTLIDEWIDEPGKYIAQLQIDHDIYWTCTIGKDA